MRHHQNLRRLLLVLVFLTLLHILALGLHHLTDKLNLLDYPPLRLLLLLLIVTALLFFRIRRRYCRLQEKLHVEAVKRGMLLVLAPHPEEALESHDLFRRFPGHYLKREGDWPCPHTVFELTGDPFRMQFSCFLADEALRQAAVKEISHEWHGTQITAVTAERIGTGVVTDFRGVVSDPIACADEQEPSLIVWHSLRLKKRDVFPLHIPAGQRKYGTQSRDQAETFLAAVNATAVGIQSGVQLLVRPAPQSITANWSGHLKRLEDRLNRRGTRSRRSSDGLSMTSQAYGPTHEHLLREEIAAVAQRIGEVKYEVCIRIWAAGSSTALCEQAVAQMAQNIQAETRGTFNELETGEQGNTWAPVCQRQFPHKGGFILTASELGRLFHMPDKNTMVLYPKLQVSAATVRGPGAEVIVPLELVPDCIVPGVKRAPGTRVYGTFDLPTGETLYVGHSLKATQAHALITGANGTGKSVTAANITRQDWLAGNAVLVIDPHGALVDKILECVPLAREKDVCVLDMESSQPFQFNICRVGRRQGVTKSVEYLMEAIRIGEPASWDSSVGMKEVLENAFMIALCGNENACLADVANVMDVSLQPALIAKVNAAAPEAQDAVYFWKEVFPNWNKNDQRRSLTAAQRRLNKFLKSSTLRRTLASNHTTFDLAEAVKARRLILAPMPESMGVESKRIWSALLVREFITVMMSIPEAERPPTTLVIDELRDTIGNLADYVMKIVEQLRKYGTSGNFFTQAFDHLPLDVLAVLKNECRTQICFNCGVDNARIAAEVMGEGITPRDIQKLPPYHAFVKLAVPGAQTSPCLISMLPPARVAPEPKPNGRAKPRPPADIWQPAPAGLPLAHFGAQEVLCWLETGGEENSEAILTYLYDLSPEYLADIWRLKQELERWKRAQLLVDPWILPGNVRRIKALSAATIGIPWWLSDVSYAQKRTQMPGKNKSRPLKSGAQVHKGTLYK